MQTVDEVLSTDGADKEIQYNMWLYSYAAMP